MYDQPWSRRKKITVYSLVFLLLAGVATGVLALLSMRTVPSGYAGVKLSWGKIIGTVEPGLHFVNPIGEDIVNMDLQLQKFTLESLSCGTLDMQEVKTTISINYHLDSGFVSDIYQNLRNEYEARVITNNVQESLKATTAKFKVEELLSRREEVKVMFLETLRARLEGTHILVDSVQLEDYQFSESFTAAIEAKATAEQRALEALNKLKQIEYEAQQMIIQADAQKNATITNALAAAEAAIIEANATAQAIVIEAGAEAEAISMINTALSQIVDSEAYLEYMALLIWDGVLPIWWGSDVLPFIEVPTEIVEPIS